MIATLIRCKCSNVSYTTLLMSMGVIKNQKLGNPSHHGHDCSTNNNYSSTTFFQLSTTAPLQLTLKY